MSGGPSGSRDGGAVLLEVVVALAIVATVGVAAVSLAAQSLRSVEVALQREAEVEEAAKLLSAVWLWPRSDLDRHLGQSTQGAYHLRVQRPEVDLYAVEVAHAESGASLLRTVLFRDPDA